MDRKISSKGLTLIELLIVLSIMAILFSIGIPVYTKWKVKYDVEYDIKELFSMINRARIKSFIEKKACGIYFGSSPFSVVQLKCDTDDDGSITDSGSETIATCSLKKKFISTASYVKFIDGIAINFINIHPDNIHITSYRNCISVSLLRVIIGKWNGANCEY